MTNYNPIGAYDVNAVNTNRIVRFRIEPANSGDADNALFGMLRGRNGMGYPRYGRLTTVPTANQNLAQLRTSLVARALARYAVLVGAYLGIDSFNTSGATANFAPALYVEFETYGRGVFFNNAWVRDVTQAHDTTNDITDTVGVGGMVSGAKTKHGLARILAELATVRYDGGTTGPFGTLSRSGNITLPDGSVTRGAPTIANGTGVGVNASGLMVYYVD